MRAQGQTGLRPSVEVGDHIDGSSSSLLLANGPVLVECCGAIDRWLINTLSAVQVVGAAVGCYAAEFCCPRTRIVSAKVLYDVVLD